MTQTINQQLYDFLKSAGIVDPKMLDEVFSHCQAQNVALTDELLNRDLVSDENLGKIVADVYGLPFVQLSQVAIADEVLRIVPELVAKKQRLIVFKTDDKGVQAATSQPSNQQVIDFVQKKVGKPVTVYYASEAGITKALSLYNKEISQTFSDLIAANIAEAQGDRKADAPIIKIVDMLIQNAYQNAASDIHIEPQEEETLVRFRIDGELHDVIHLPPELDRQVVTRIKVLANLRTDEHLEPQDGKIMFATDESVGPAEKLDLRVSIVPLTKGEKVVMRLLSDHSRQFSLTDLGFSETDLKKIEAAYRLPHGMILSTGPTGSGKTTTLYAILKLINKRNINIMTIEDPVEYEVENVNQIQVNTQTGLTFAKGLRSIVRQDPNVILVGEIRDEETADIAINSAMTGHLVLSTLHTNDAVTTFPRLTDMKVEPYLIASSIKVVIAQRLVRKICQSCRVSEQVSVADVDAQIKKYLGSETTFATYRGKGCPVCHNTGYAGRIGIFEVIVMDDELEAAVVAQQSATELRDLAVSKGMRTMLQDGIEKVKQGMTTIDELLRVTKD